jgi:hypothetical protein
MDACWTFPSVDLARYSIAARGLDSALRSGHFRRVSADTLSKPMQPRRTC